MIKIFNNVLLEKLEKEVNDWISENEHNTDIYVEDMRIIVHPDDHSVTLIIPISHTGGR